MFTTSITLVNIYFITCCCYEFCVLYILSYQKNTIIFCIISVIKEIFSGVSSHFIYISKNKCVYKLLVQSTVINLHVENLVLISWILNFLRILSTKIMSTVWNQVSHALCDRMAKGRMKKSSDWLKFPRQWSMKVKK